MPFFSGCLATTNLAKDPVLPREHQTLLSHVAELATTRCIRVNLDPITGEKISNGVRFTQKMTIRRYFLSNTDWSRLEANSQGVWDNIYYNKSNNRIICGQKEWTSFSDNSTIIFTEYGKFDKVLNSENKPSSQSLSGKSADINKPFSTYDEWNKADWERIKKEDSLLNFSHLSLSELCQLSYNETVNPAVIKREIIRRGESGFYCNNLESQTPSSKTRNPTAQNFNPKDICRDYAILLKINLDKIQNPNKQQIISNDNIDSAARVLKFIEVAGEDVANSILLNC